MRIGEAPRLEWTDIDTERNIITLDTPQKNGNSRIWEVSNLLTQKLESLQKKSEYVFANRCARAKLPNICY